MRTSFSFAAAVAALAAVVDAASLADLCTVSSVTNALPLDVLLGLTLQPATVTAAVVENYNASGSSASPNAIVSFCNVTFGYTHDGEDDQVLVNYFMPAPDAFLNRYVSQGGGALDIYAGVGALAGGIQNGAVNGGTDGGFGSFSTSYQQVILLANGTINLNSLNMFGYQAHYELGVIGRQFTRNFYSMADSAKLYSYFQACSEGGREAFSQLQRYGDLWDGATVGAPALRYSFQQLQHLYSNIVEKTLDYAPPPCELAVIVNATINACDGLDGKLDGVVARTDLCSMSFNLQSMVGKSYYCAATSSPRGSTPVQSGKVTKQGVQVANAILNGLHDSSGKRVYLSYQITADFHDATTAYNTATDTWEISIVGLGGYFVTQMLQKININNLQSLAGVDYDQLKAWMIQGMQEYQSTLQVDWPDLSALQQSGGKIIHFHGESDSSVPTASSTKYYDSVRKIMYPGMGYNASTAALQDWYRLFLVPGGAHCDWNVEQPNGPWPQTGLAQIIDWVEAGKVPETLQAVVGDYSEKHAGEVWELCAFPLRPLWVDNGTAMECVYDQKSVNSWKYDFNGVNVPVY